MSISSLTNCQYATVRAVKEITNDSDHPFPEIWIQKHVTPRSNVIVPREEGFPYGPPPRTRIHTMLYSAGGSAIRTI